MAALASRSWSKILSMRNPEAGTSAQAQKQSCDGFLAAKRMPSWCRSCSARHMRSGLRRDCGERHVPLGFDLPERPPLNDTAQNTSPSNLLTPPLNPSIQNHRRHTHTHMHNRNLHLVRNTVPSTRAYSSCNFARNEIAHHIRAVLLTRSTGQSSRHQLVAHTFQRDPKLICSPLKSALRISVADLVNPRPTTTLPRFTRFLTTEAYGVVSTLGWVDWLAQQDARSPLHQTMNLHRL